MPRELLFSVTKKDLEITYFSGKGKGGQHRNRHKNCVRLKHSDSGALVTGQSHKERKSNLKEAFENLVKDSKFKIWHNRKVYEALEGKRIEEKVDEMITAENLILEVRVEKKWREVEFIDL